MAETISIDAVKKRINRVLKHQNLILRKTNIRDSSQYGEYMVIEISRNFIVDNFNDLESYARENGILKPNEKLAK